ncbi:hypothetical protein X797_008270 [Metarhizium robertsii]|uniref:Uncharacterized protein n=1 Tax=Metarhizium robertsii TaxID=568076 RepID=A0A014PN62_9HYPO|nr:hypothetical protein X797_008270 [Metarhizium robertsii]
MDETHSRGIRGERLKRLESPTSEKNNDAVCEIRLNGNLLVTQARIPLLSRGCQAKAGCHIHRHSTTLGLSHLPLRCARNRPRPEVARVQQGDGY